MGYGLAADIATNAAGVATNASDIADLQVDGVGDLGDYLTVDTAADTITFTDPGVRRHYPPPPWC